MMVAFEEYTKICKVAGSMKELLKSTTENTKKEEIMYMIIKYDGVMNKLEEYKALSNQYSEKYIYCTEKLGVVASRKIIKFFRSIIKNKGNN